MLNCRDGEEFWFEKFSSFNCMTNAQLRQLRSSPTRARVWTLRSRCFVLLLAVLQLVAPTWHVCSMSGNTHEHCGENVEKTVAVSSKRVAESDEHSHEHPHSHQHNEAEHHSLAAARHIEYSINEIEATHAHSHDDTSHHSTHDHEASDHEHRHEVREHTSQNVEKCTDGKGRCCSVHKSRASLVQTPMQHEMTCLALLLTTMPSQMSSSISLPPVARAMIHLPSQMVVSRSATTFALCDARAPPVLS